MVADTGVAEGRHFAGEYTRILLSYLEAQLGANAVTELLAEAKEARPPEDLLVETSWNSYPQLRRLLESAAKALGGPAGLIAVGRSVFDEVSTGQLTELIQHLGSVEALYKNIGPASAALTSIVSMDAQEVADGEWLIQQRFAPGFEPFEEYCSFSLGLHQSGPRLFGFLTPEVVEEQCQRHGHPSCAFRVRWDQDVADRSGYLPARVQVLEARLDQLQQTVADLVSSGDLESVLERILASAAKAVRAPAFVLALDALANVGRRVRSVGLAGREAAQYAAELLDDSSAVAPGRLVVAVTSTQRRYGCLAAYRPSGGFLPRELPVLEAYGRLAAAALDSATALEEARREAATANILLGLSTALAEIASIDEMAAKLVRAVPGVIGCDRALVSVIVPEGTHLRVAAAYGYPPPIQSRLRALKVPLPVERPTSLEFHTFTGEGSEFTHRVMAETGTVAGVTIAIVVDATFAGYLTAAVTHAPERLRDTGDLEQRLRGLASQAATAIRNARLLDQIRHQAFHDALTGLPNRALILDRAEQMMARAKRGRHPVTALFIDLDGFKDINDTLGHAAGDDLLRAVADRLAAVLRRGDTIGRLGGDEFVILVEGSALGRGPDLVAERVLAALHAPFELAGNPIGPIVVTASIGIATGYRNHAGELLRDADVALYEAKASGKDCYAIFHPEMQFAVQDRLLLQLDLRGALEADQFFLVYQPINNLASGDITGIEALLRWRHPVRGVMHPGLFIPLLEDSGLINDIGRWVLHRACDEAVQWQATGVSLDIAVNVSVRQLHADRFIDDVRDALASSGMEPGRLVLEFTETTLIRDVEATTRRLAALKALGVRIAIDDFGTGYSSLTYLRQLPVDMLKIDRTFVGALGVSQDSAALVHTLVQLGRTLGLQTVAEGVEELNQYRRLRDEQCDSGQGFLFAHPLTAGDLAHFLREHVSSTDLAPDHRIPSP